MSNAVAQQALTLAASSVIWTLLPRNPVAYEKPATHFDWFTYGVRRRADGVDEVYHLDTGLPFDVSELKPAVVGTDYFVGYAGASDANAGTSRAASLLTMNAALTKTDVARIYVCGRTYPRTLGTWTGSWTPARNVQIIGEGAPAVFSLHDDLTWTLQTGSTYRATWTPVAGVWDARTTRRDADGCFERFTLRTSIAAVDANPGSWYAAGGIVYVRTADSRNLSTSGPAGGSDTDLRVFSDVFGATCAGGADTTLYLENLAFHGGSEGFIIQESGTGRPTLITRNVEFSYADTGTPATGNGLSAIGAVCWHQNVRAVHNRKDGLNYRAGSGKVSQVVEVDSFATRNGYDDAHNNNGSTGHEASFLIRVGGDYGFNEGPSLVDVNTCYSWCLGCRAHDSLTNLAAPSRFNFLFDGFAWLDNCVSENEAVDPDCYDVYSSAGTIHLRNFTAPAGRIYTQFGAGTVTYSYP